VSVRPFFLALTELSRKMPRPAPAGSPTRAIRKAIHFPSSLTTGCGVGAQLCAAVAREGWGRPKRAAGYSRATGPPGLEHHH
jgi:hypothetical protein